MLPSLTQRGREAKYTKIKTYFPAQHNNMHGESLTD